MATILLYEDEQFKILKGKDYIVVRKSLQDGTEAPYEYHSHFKRLTGARILLELFYKHTIPDKEYFKIAMQRVTTEDEFEQFKVKTKPKDKYVNLNRSSRKLKSRR